MLMYTTIGTNDIARADAFWSPLMASLGHDPLPGLGDNWRGWGKDYDGGFGFYVCLPFDGQPAHSGNGGTFAFPGRNAAHIREMHALCLANGGTDEGAPGTRDYYTPDFYVAYARDPDGHKLAFVYHLYDASKDM